MKFIYLKNKYFYIYIFITILFFSLINSFFATSLAKSLNMYKYYKNVNYDYTLVLDNKKQDSYYVIDENFGIKLNEDKSLSGYINSKSLMLTNQEYMGLGFYNENNVVIGDYKILEENECSITKNLSEVYNLRIGSVIYSIYDDISYEYKVVNILKDTYDFINPNVNSFSGYIFSGFRENKTQDTKYLSFAKYSDEIDKNVVAHCFVNEVVKQCKAKLLSLSLIVLISIALDVLVYFILNKNYIFNVIRLFNIGYKKSRLFLYLFLKFIIMLIFLLLGIFIAIISKVMLYYIVEIIIVSSIIYLIDNIRLRRI